MFRTVSQTAVHYRSSSLSEGRAGRLRGGDRPPWVTVDEPSEGMTDNFAPLTSLDWQVHVYGEPTPELVEACRKRGLALHTFPWRSTMRRSGLRQDAVYLIRPDGYIGLADTDASPAKLENYLDSRGVQPLQADVPRNHPGGASSHD
jgi:hypothetical protein